ncbi:hypothetical protein C0Q70_15428 [Pomacea canaliculata]|uniref:Uncharacterized protein n=1 Tax=Pomacea canaliculata TaxID=400727 RepID=A0A2T7NUV6_POMCA|nr:hypothetical protein C0Q70_15428 [Pomacea canaliculata]
MRPTTPLLFSQSAAKEPRREAGPHRRKFHPPTCPRASGNRWAKPTGPGPTPRCPESPLLHTPSSLISWHHAENFCLLPVRGRWRGTGDSACPPHDEGLPPGWMLNKSFTVRLSLSSAHSTGEARRLTLWEVVHDQDEYGR